MSDRIKILFLAANPADAGYRSRLDKEVREIGEKIGIGKNRDSFELVSEWAVRPGDLQALLQKHRPHIVHFSGRGNKTEGIILEDDFGQAKLIDEQALARLFGILKDNMLVVVLNGCFGKSQAEAICKTIDCTVGVNATIEDEAAIVFAAYFYQSLAFGRSLKDAFDLAVIQLQLERLGGADLPELLVREGVDASQIFLLRQSSEPRPPIDDEDLARPGRNERTFRAIPQENNQQTAFSFLAWLCLAVSTFLVTEVVTRPLGSEGSWLDITTKVLKAALIILAIMLVALAAISAIPPWRPVLGRAVHPGVFTIRRSKRNIIIIITILLGALGLRLSLPAVARYYNEKGFEYQAQGDLSLARETYQRALRLEPSYAQVHYNLATIYEDLQPEEAIEEYLLAIKYDSKIYPAYNNLARLYILRGKDNDYDSALRILHQAIQLSPPDERIYYSLYKNLGWASYSVKNYAQAETYLRRAVSLREKEGAAAAHCLLAYVLREQGKPGVIEECEDCVRFAPGEADVEPKWLDDAKECLRKGGRE